MKKKTAARNQDDMNEKLSYQTKCKEWKELQARNDIGIIAGLTNRSTVLISKAVNKGIGSLFVLRAINEYYQTRKQAIK